MPLRIVSQETHNQSRDQAREQARGAAAPLIVFESVGKSFVTKTGESVEAIRDISFTVADNQFITIVGPSGCGKSTLLRMLAGLMPPSAGRLTIAGQSPASAANLAMVFQRPALLPWRNVLGNILLPSVIIGMDRRKALQRAYELLALVGLSDFADKYPSELSGGMQQRVAICRALLCGPTLLLMDEPFAALDALTREELSVELLRIWQHEPKTVLFVTHSIPEAVLLADQVIIISSRPGRIVRTVTIDLPRPRDLSLMQSALFQDYAAAIRAAISKNA
ncbi:MAG: ABC transporter ATP-binding protein [Xanthobacteraceae bacterium]|jgi:NitT/TauT family transport system ATP-binding protein